MGDPEGSLHNIVHAYLHTTYFVHDTRVHGDNRSRAQFEVRAEWRLCTDYVCALYPSMTGIII